MATDNLTWKWIGRIATVVGWAIAVTLFIVNRTEPAKVPAPVNEIPELRKDVTEIKVSVKGIETDMEWLKRSLSPRVAKVDDEGN